MPQGTIDSMALLRALCWEVPSGPAGEERGEGPRPSGGDSAQRSWGGTCPSPDTLTQGKPQVQEERASSRRLLPRGHGGRGRRSVPAQGPHPFQETSGVSEMIHERITEEQRGRVHKDRSLLVLTVPTGSLGLESSSPLPGGWEEGGQILTNCSWNLELSLY